MQRLSPVDILVWGGRVTQEELSQGGVICFCWESEQPLLADAFFGQMRGKGLNVRLISSESSLQAVKAQLAVSFLGQQLFYRYAGFDLLSASHKRGFIDFVSTYSGPHWVVFYSQDLQIIKQLQGQKVYCVDASLKFDRIAGWRLWLYLLGSVIAVETELLFADIFSRFGKCSVDQILVASRYAIFLRQNAHRFFAEYGEDILGGTVSLYDLVGALLACKREAFFVIWKKAKKSYPDQFWLSFFSEHIFRAHWFIFYLQKGDSASAQQIGTRLPFQFLKKDYKLTDVLALRKLHQDLYSIDWGLKNGQEATLDLAFLKFFRMANQKSFL